MPPTKKSTTSRSTTQKTDSTPGKTQKTSSAAQYATLNKNDFEQRIAKGASLDDLVKESKMKYLAWMSQSQLRQRAGVPSDGNIEAGVTPAGASPVGNNRDDILGRIKESADYNPYTGYGDRYQAIKDLAATYQNGEPVGGWERIKGLLSSGVDALSTGGNYGSAVLGRWVEKQADAIQRRFTGGLTTGSPITDDDTLHEMEGKALRADDKFRSYIFGEKPPAETFTASRVPIYGRNLEKAHNLYESTVKPLGVDQDTYTQILRDANTDGSGTVKQDELGAYLNKAIDEETLTEEQANAIWHSVYNQSGSTSFLNWRKKAGTITGEELLYKLAEEMAAADMKKDKGPEPDEAIRLKDWIFGKRPKGRG